MRRVNRGRKLPESALQRELVKEAKRLRAREQIEALALLYAIPNGSSRHPQEAMRLKLEGVQPGMPDLCLPVPRGEHAALYLESKAGRSPLSKEQRERKRELEAAGNKVVVYRSIEEGRRALLDYLGHG